jgi:hypothetical protein
MFVFMGDEQAHRWSFSSKAQNRQIASSHTHETIDAQVHESAEEQGTKA